MFGCVLLFVCHVFLFCWFVLVDLVFVVVFGVAWFCSLVSEGINHPGWESKLFIVCFYLIGLFLLFVCLFVICVCVFGCLFLLFVLLVFCCLFGCIYCLFFLCFCLVLVVLFVCVFFLCVCVCVCFCF